MKQAFIQRLEEGKSWTVDNLLLISGALGVPGSTLLGEEATISPRHGLLLKYLNDRDFENFFLVLAPLLPGPTRD